MNNETMKKIAISASIKEGNVNSIQDILNWIEYLNKYVEVSIKKAALSESEFWYLDQETGEIKNRNNSFFSIKAIRIKDKNCKILEQPVIIQNEIGYLGIICKEINGVMNFLMQAKIEPGNINKIQLSPTIQATKSNFLQKHGGKQPAYFDFFINASKYEIVVDQLQSEQSSRFYKKRNRNIIIKVDEEIDILPSHKWMTLGQIKEIMKYDNLVNMDTRTVISCIPYSLVSFDEIQLEEIKNKFQNKSLFNSMFMKDKENMLPVLYQEINNCKMFTEDQRTLIGLNELADWEFHNNEYACKEKSPYKVIFCDIVIEGREVKRWSQPLFEAVGMACFGLFFCEDKNTVKFLINLKAEIGCFDIVEIGPTVQIEHNEDYSDNSITKLFMRKWKDKVDVYNDVILSEEGGRFYHEQNHNVIIKVSRDELKELPTGYLWADFYTLNLMMQFNNCINIQLRNLLALLEV